MSHFTPKQIRKQLLNDLIGKDSHRGVTLTYSWMANQIGHFSLGFIPSFLLYSYLCKPNKDTNYAIFSAVCVSIFWTLFELYNFLGPLLFKKESKSKFIYIKSKAKYIFKPKYFNIAHDTVTDLLFFYLGAFLFSEIITHSKINTYLIIIIPLLLIFPASKWFMIKMHQSYANFPYQFRLSQWNHKNPDDDNRALIKSIKHYEKVSENDFQHLLIFGTKQSGKTSLAIGLLNELSINKKKCHYTTAVKIISMCYDTTASIQDRLLWNWKNTDYLVIDDVNPGYPISDDIIDAKKFLEHINSNECNALLFKNKNIIWVMGDQYNNENQWVNMLNSIDVKTSKISIINLSGHK